MEQVAGKPMFGKAFLKFQAEPADLTILDKPVYLVAGVVFPGLSDRILLHVQLYRPSHIRDRVYFNPLHLRFSPMSWLLIQVKFKRFDLELRRLRRPLLAIWWTLDGSRQN